MFSYYILINKAIRKVGENISINKNEIVKEFTISLFLLFPKH